MMTRHGRRSPDDEEKMMDDALRVAGLLEADMSIEQKREYYKVIQQSKEGQSPSRTLAQESPDHELRDSFSRLSTSKRQEAENLESDIFEDVDNSLQSAVKVEPSASKNDDAIIIEDRSSNRGRLSLSLNKTSSEKSIGRGRAKPMKYKYPTLPINSPGQKNSPISSSFASSSKEVESTPRPQDHSQSPETNSLIETANQSPQATIPDEIDNALLQSSNGTESLETSVFKKSEESQHEVVDVESSSQEEKEASSCPAASNKPDSPVEDMGDENLQPQKTVQLGKISCHASPLEILLRPVPSSSFSLFIKDLEKYQGDKTLWMKHAKEACQTARYRFFDKLLAENTQWGPPISDTGYNNQTLFKQPVPKYSKLFGNSSDQQGLSDFKVSGRAERQSKMLAMSKISENSQQWAEPDFHSLRRSKQRDHTEDTSENRPQRKKTGTFVDDEDCIEYPSESSDDIWPTEKTEQKKQTADSDSEASPDSPNVSRSSDPYDVHDEDWSAAPSRNRYKSNRKTGKPNQSDFEVDSKPSTRMVAATPGQRGQHSKSLRIRKGAISRPSEHATAGNNSKNKGASVEQFEDTNSSNNNRWIGSNSMGGPSDIPIQKFYPPKVSQPRNSPSTMTRKNSRESRNFDDLLSSPSSSGKHHDGRTEEAAVEKTQCPICCKSFPSAEIEAHSSGCDDWAGGADGEKLLEEVESKGGSDKIAKVTYKGESSSSDGENQSACDQCKQLFTQNLLLNHIKECRGIPSTSSSGLKRGNSPVKDDGPAKKSSRLAL